MTYLPRSARELDEMEVRSSRRADIHDGPEHRLQPKAGYIDARPLTASSLKSSCNARPDHTFGSFDVEAAIVDVVHEVDE